MSVNRFFSKEIYLRISKNGSFCVDVVRDQSRTLNQTSSSLSLLWSHLHPSLARFALQKAVMSVMLQGEEIEKDACVVEMLANSWTFSFSKVGGSLKTQTATRSLFISFSICFQVEEITFFLKRPRGREEGRSRLESDAIKS